jgi:hypothetical protein
MENISISNSYYITTSAHFKMSQYGDSNLANSTSIMAEIDYRKCDMYNDVGCFETYDNNCEERDPQICDFDGSNEKANASSNINIYRFKFTQEFMDQLFQFSKIHQYDDRKSFKDAWKIWAEDNEEIVDSEVSRLKKLQYDGDIMDKMYKSARYYFRKKSTMKVDPKDRRQYVGVQKQLLLAMDSHISTSTRDPYYKPSEGFSEFCSSHLELLQEEVKRFVEDHKITDSAFIQDKIKKTYKNRYFMFISKQT